jgi:hypothetical protein
MITLKESIPKFKAILLDWDSDGDTMTLSAKGIEGSIGAYGVEFDISGSRIVSFSNSNHYQPEDVTVGDASIEVSNMVVFDADFEDMKISKEEQALLIKQIILFYE